MTRAEYLEFVQESLSFPDVVPTNIDAPERFLALRDTPEVCDALRQAHDDYCSRVADILGLKHEKGEL